jgi:hypothetical protein
LHNKAQLLFLKQNLYEAQISNEESLKIAINLDIKYLIFNCTLLSAKIAFAQGDKTAPNRLYEMLEQTEDDEQTAELHYELWKMLDAQTSKVLKTFEVSTAEDHRQKALELYQQLYEKTPKFEYKKRIEELVQDLTG